MEIRLDGRVALITGGAQGLGAGIARKFAEAGARVAVADIVPLSAVQAEFAELQARCPDALYVQADVADEVAVSTVVSIVLQAFGEVDTLVNNAGVISQSRVADLSVAEWDRVMSINLRGVFLCCRAILPHMISRHSGRIINVASQLAYLGGARTAHYSASKGGVVSFTRSLAREVLDDGILVNGIAPGPIETPLQQGVTAEERAQTCARLPIGRLGEVHEVAPTAVFLASDAATFYVGQFLGPNGGDVMP